MRRREIVLAACAVVVLLSTFVYSADQYAVVYERNALVPMRDGITLKADIYRPQAEGKFPVLLQRTPYNKDNGVTFALKAVARGYVVIFEDVRGRYASEGCRSDADARCHRTPASSCGNLPGGDGE